MSLISRIRSWLKIPEGTKLVITDTGKIKANVISHKGNISSDFSHGIEIFNDNSTPAEFVISMLIKHFGLKKTDATTAMLICHSSESILVELDADRDTDEIVKLITSEAQKHGYPLICKLATPNKTFQPTPKNDVTEL